MVLVCKTELSASFPKSVCVAAPGLIELEELFCRLRNCSSRRLARFFLSHAAAVSSLTASLFRPASLDGRVIVILSAQMELVMEMSL